LSAIGEPEDTQDQNKDDADSIPRLVSANTSQETLVYPCGFQVGIYLQTNGVMIIGTDEVTGEDGINYSPASNKVKSGDYITKVNDIDVSSKNQLLFLVNKYGDEDLILTIIRNDKSIRVKIKPVKTGENEYKMGIWVRDDTQGIGTMTFLTESGDYAALGHGISDIDTGELLDSEGGILYQANVWGIKKGESGSPGALYGMISYEEDKIQGSILENTSIGIYGSLTGQEKTQELIQKYSLEPVELASRDEIHTGSAVIRSCVSGELCDYEVEIEKINERSSNNKGLVLKVTDKRLLELTNGIVQGMSGTPILQDGKLIGAVTHVFVNDSTMGYGIFADVMIEEIK
jgi:stage IV sporulation protein B